MTTSSMYASNAAYARAVVANRVQRGELVVEDDGMKINAWRDQETDTQHLKIEIPGSFITQNCQAAPGAESISQRDTERIIRNAVLQAFGLQLTAPMAHRRSVSGEMKEEPGEPEPTGNCKTCWQPLAGKKWDPANPDECSECAEL